MYLTTHLLIAAAGFYCVYFTLLSFLNRGEYERKRRRMGCVEVQGRYPHKDPIWGFDLLLRDGKHLKNGTFFVESQRSFAAYGATYEYLFLGMRWIRTKEPKNFQAVLVNDFEKYGLQPIREGIAEPLFGRGINTTDGEYWQYSRSLIKPTFAKTELCDLGLLEFHFQRLMKLLPRDGSAIDLQPLFSRLFLDTSTEFLFGRSADTLLPAGNEEGLLFVRSFDYAISGLGTRVRLGKLKFLHRDAKWFESIRNVHAWVERHIDEVLETEAERQRGFTARSEVGSRYILLHEMAKKTQDRLDLRSQIMAVFMPSRDTTAYLVSNLFHVLARQPKVWTRLRDEVSAAGATISTVDGLKSMTYLQWCINETHRMYPVTDSLPRCALADAVLPVGGGPSGTDPVLVRKGDYVSLNIYCMEHDKETWGSDADEFRAERWKGLKPRLAFQPFGSGLRTCPAQPQVGIEAAYVVARMVQEFSRVEARDDEPWTELWGLGPHSRYGVQVALTPADKR